VLLENVPIGELERVGSSLEAREALIQRRRLTGRLEELLGVSE
jgi:hypothetical protein